MFPSFASRKDDEAWFKHREWCRNRFNELMPQILTQDGLAPTTEIIVQDDYQLFLKRDSGVQVYPHSSIQGVVQHLIASPLLWKQSAIRIQSERSWVSRAPIFGVPFQRAVSIALRDKISKSVFWVPSSIQSEDLIYAQLLVRITKRKESNGAFLNVEAWEWIGEGIEVDYTHMLLTHDAGRITHLDGALIVFENECDITSIFATGEKRKGCRYEKSFRLDGEISPQSAVKLIRSFFPVEELVDEYFEYVPEWPDALEASA